MICFPSVGKRKLCPDAKGGVGLRGVTADVAETACTAHTARRLYTAHPYHVTIGVNIMLSARHKSRLHHTCRPWTGAKLDQSFDMHSNNSGMFHSAYKQQWKHFKPVSLTMERSKARAAKCWLPHALNLDI